ncbi:tRNA epoxyqueuosine(34) reductase QueG [Chloroflexota bacterium]
MSQTLTQFIKKEALAAGFHLAGVTSPDPPPHLPVFRNWLASGRNAGMEYLATERSIQRRSDPLKILAECRSILVLGFRYPAPLHEPTADRSRPRGRIAAYARGKDYHLMLPDMMDTLVYKLETRLEKPFPYRYYTDSGPILERELAQRSGLGWIGKNTCLIHPQYGSYILLAEILLGIELEADKPFEADRCGSCTRCVQACPTNCILPDRTLDARHCISYLTIEHKGSIPPELMSAMGEHVFGCDICQQVCPWNGKAFRQAPRPWEDTQQALNVDLQEELKLNPQEFNLKYRETALMRTRRNRYLRNVLIALENSGYSDKKREAVRMIMNDKSSLIREQAKRILDKWT